MRNRLTQRRRLRELFEGREGEWIPLPEILAMNIAQFGARLKELRDLEGMDIKNKMEHQDTVVLSWYKYTRPKGQGKLFTVGPEYEQRRHYLETDNRRL